MWVTATSGYVRLVFFSIKLAMKSYSNVMIGVLKV